MALTPCQNDRILIVDDEEALRHTLKLMLAPELPGVLIDTATNGMEAMKRFHADHHAVILIDLFMPVMNGEQAYRGIEQICAKDKWEMPAIVFYTAHNPSRELRNMVAQNPRHCLLQKPVKNEVLAETIRSRLVPPAALPANDPSA